MATLTQSIREIVATNASAATVLQRFEIDLCSHANKSLEQACAGLQLSVDQVLEKLADAANEQCAVLVDVGGYSLSRLIQHIVRTHHQYVRRELPRLFEIARKVADKHGKRAPELEKIEVLLGELRADMFAHLQKEEQVLFPFITEMDQESATSCAPPRACFKTVAQPVSMMIMEHAMAEGNLGEMRNLTHGFQPPVWACATFVALYTGLRDFAADLRQHVHLENDLLFPRAVELESELNRRGPK